MVGWVGQCTPTFSNQRVQHAASLHLPHTLLQRSFTVITQQYFDSQFSSMTSASDTVEDFVMVGHNAPMGISHSEAYLDLISQYIEELSEDLREISLSIHDNPELQFKEYHAHRLLTGYLRKQDGWGVTPSAYGIETAFVASFDSGERGPVVSFNAEYDALVGIGHACGHNLIAMISLAAALVTARTLSEMRLGGKVVLFGTPAEGV